MGHLIFLSSVLLALSLVSVSGGPQDILNNIYDLKGKDFGHNYPRHGLKLLYWFSRDFITFDNNNVMQPSQDPSDGAFGFHFYSNYENVLPLLDNQDDYRYYVVGNLFDTEDFPNYVTADFRSSYYIARNQRNRDRIIVRQTEFGSIDQVYITQHPQGSNAYDRSNIYRISQNLIRNIRNLSLRRFLTQSGYVCNFHDELKKRDLSSVNENYNEVSKGNRIFSP